MMEKDPEYIVYLTYLNSEILLNIIRWSDRAILELEVCFIVRKKLTKNFIYRLNDELMNSSTGSGFIDPVEIAWSATCAEETAFAWYMSTDLGKLKRVLEKLDPGKLINLYYVY